MLTYILLGVLALIVLLLLVIGLQSNTFRLQRQLTIPAPARDLFTQVADFRKWQAWSPWENIDPNLQRTYSGAPAGTGAVYDWSGDKCVGQGRMTILETRPNEFIRIKLEFFKPFKGNNTTEFNFEPVGTESTRVTWSMYGPKNFLAKALHMLCNMEKMIGGQYEKGLAKLQTVVTEERAATSPANV